MDVGTNKTRKDTRAVVSLVARYRSPSTFEYVEEACCDVSLGGMFIRSKDPAAAGTLLKLECESGVGAQIRGVARVVWLRAHNSEYGPSGMGVKFVKLDPESKDVITRIVQELADAGIESPSMSSAPEHRGKPPVKRGTSSTPAAAESQPAAAAQVAHAIEAPAHSSAPANSAPVLIHARDRVAAPPPKISSKPPALPAISSRPAPNDALLAHPNVDSLDIEPGPSMRDVGRDLSPLAPVMRSGRISSAPPPPDNDRGRAFWLVAGAVVALGVIVAVFSTRGTQDDRGDEGATGASPAVQGPPAPPTEPTAEQLAQPSAAEHANTQPTEPAAPDTQATDQAVAADTHPAAQPEGQENLDNTAIAAAPAVVAPSPAAPSTAGDTTAAPAHTGTTLASAPTQTKPAPSAQQVAPAAPPPAAAVVPQVPVLRIVPAEQAATADQQVEAALPQAAAQPQSAQPSAASPSDGASKPAAPPTTASTGTAPSINTPAANPQPANAPPALAPGEVAHVIMFTSRPSGASVFVGSQSVITPGEINLGAMPTRVRVTAQKPGFESSTVWINNTSEFQKVGSVLRREVHFVLPPLPGGAVVAPPAAPSAPGAKPQSAAPAPASSLPAASSVAPAQPSAPTQAPSAAPSPPPSAAIPEQP